MFKFPSACIALSLAVFVLAGCGSQFNQPLSSSAPGAASIGAIKGMVHGGQQSVVGAHVYLYAAGTGGNGGNGIAASTANASTSLLTSSVSINNPGNSGLDADSNYYVTTDAGGNFSVSGDYICVTGTQVYLYVIGGDTGGGNNSGAGFLAGLGQCPASGDLAEAVPYVSVNELTTITTAYALAGFATDATHISSDSGVSGNSTGALAATGIANAMANVANITSIAAGSALATTPAGNGTVPQSEINTLADILAACVNTTEATSGPCSTLFGSATSDGTASGMQPTDTATAAIYIAQHPGVNIGTLYGLVTAEAPFMPVLSTSPNDFTIGVNFYGGGQLALSNSGIAVDASGNVWVPTSNNTIVELSSQGAFLSGSSGYSLGSVSNNGYCGFVAIDLLDNVWVSNYGASSVSELSSGGNLLSPLIGYTGVGLSEPEGIAVDASNNIWIADEYPSAVTKFAVNGSSLTSITSYTVGGVRIPVPIAFDGSGDVWTGGYLEVSELSNTGLPISVNGYTSPSISRSAGLAIDSAGTAWVAGDAGLNGSLVKISNSGTVQAIPYVSTQFPSGLAIDGNSDIWIAAGFQSLLEYTDSGTLVTPSNGYAQEAIRELAIDQSGNVWLGDEYNVIEVIGAAVPVVTPLALGVSKQKIASRP